MAEDRVQRHHALNASKVEAARQQVKTELRAKESRERGDEEAAKRAARLKAEAASLRQQIATVKDEYRVAKEKKDAQFAAVVAAFNTYVNGLTAAAVAVE